MQLFANRFRFDGDTGFRVKLGDSAEAREAFDGADVPRSHFDDLGTAFVTIFQILSGENWNTVMRLRGVWGLPGRVDRTVGTTAGARRGRRR